jgi:prepilin-type processing-associated H-X9-DG protein
MSNETDTRGAAIEQHATSTTANDTGFANYTTPPRNCWNIANGKRYRDVGATYSKGAAWGNAEGPRTLFVTVIAPNGPSCLKHDDMRGFATASSFHSGGVNVGLADGSTRFVSETIDTGNQDGYLGQGQSSANASNPVMYDGPSTYGVWGAMGSISGGDSTTL